MARALGLGGIFFKCQDPKVLAAWYRKHLGFQLDGDVTAVFRPQTMPGEGYSVWGAFSQSTDYFSPSPREFMINLIVDDVREALAQVVAGGASQIGDIEDNEYGRFGWFVDPEQNKVELWEPLPGMDEEQ